jgi:integrase
MAMKRKRNNKWEYCIRNKAVLPKPIYLSFADEIEGDAYVARIEALIKKGIIPPELEKDKKLDEVNLTGAIRSYQLAVMLPESDTKLLDMVRERKGDSKLEMLDFKWAEAWVSEMKRQDNLAPSTIRHYVGALARCLDWLMRRSPGVLVVNPLRQLPRGYASYTQTDAAHVEAPKIDEARDRRLLPGEEDRIREILAGKKADGKERPLELKHGESIVLLFDLALETAMRLREMFTIDLSQVDINRATIFLDKTKNGSKRQVPLSSVAIAKLAPFSLIAEKGLLFPWWDGKPENLARVTALLSRQFARIFAAADCPGLRLHDLRHEATCRFYEKTNLSDLQIAKITGHKDPRMLARYANLRASDLANQLW